LPTSPSEPGGRDVEPDFESFCAWISGVTFDEAVEEHVASLYGAAPMRLLTALLIPLVATEAIGSSLPHVDRYVIEKMGDHLVPGLALVVIRNGEIIHHRGFGSLDSSQPVIIGSLSKSLTATAIMTLVDAGVLELDAPMRRYLPEVEFTDPSTNLVTMRHLLNQTSGIPADAPRAPSRNASLAEHVAALRDIRLAAEPGSLHIYSSPNYQILGRIVEVVSGEPFAAYLQRHVFAPLSMSSSSGTTDDGAARGHNLWWGVAGPSTYRWEPGRLPTASIVTSADDLGRFVLSQLGAGPQISVLRAGNCFTRASGSQNSLRTPWAGGRGPPLEFRRCGMAEHCRRTAERSSCCRNRRAA